MEIISGDSALADFRCRWTGEEVVNLLSSNNGRLRIDWSVGVGKSHNIDQVIKHVTASGKYDLVIALFPTRQLIDEQEYIHNPPKNLKIVNLVPRPNELCGEHLNKQWGKYEQSNLGALGRHNLCGSCKYHNSCTWLIQYGKGLKRAKVVFGTQIHLERSPFFISRIKQNAGAKKVLVLLDETNCLMRPFKYQVLIDQLNQFITILKCLDNQKPSKINKQWIKYCSLLKIASTTDDLISPEWQAPSLNPKWMIEVQSLGFNLFQSEFYFPGYLLEQFCLSIPESREKTSDNDLIFSVRPSINEDFMVYSGTAHQSLSEFRLGKDFAQPFKDVKFSHPGTTWYNISSSLGTKRHFPKNSKQILDFFSRLADERIKSGKKVIFIVKKCFIYDCAARIQQRLKGTKVVIDGFNEKLLKDPLIVPIIHYGTIGTNLFEDFDCCYCLSGFYINEEIINGILQDTEASNLKIDIKIEMPGLPKRRKASVVDPKHRYSNIQQLAQHALDYQEMGVVLQAVGRVRPYTKPREIITFQCANHPDFDYNKEFNSLEKARVFFNIPTEREHQKLTTMGKVQAEKAKGLTQTQVMTALSLSLRTIKSYWNYSGGCNEAL